VKEKSMTDEPTNEDRADRAQAALNAYIAHTGDAPDESHFRDLLCDLRHLAARDGAGEKFGEDRNLTFDEANDMAGRCFEDEAREADEDNWGPPVMTPVVTMTGVQDLPLQSLTDPAPDAGLNDAFAPKPKFSGGQRVYISKVDKTKTVVSALDYGGEWAYILREDDGTLDEGWREDELALESE
jgi:hypothetical protein